MSNVHPPTLDWDPVQGWKVSLLSLSRPAGSTPSQGPARALIQIRNETGGLLKHPSLTPDPAVLITSSTGVPGLALHLCRQVGPLLGIL